MAAKLSHPPIAALSQRGFVTRQRSLGVRHARRGEVYSLFLFLLIVALLFPQSQSGNNIYSNLGRFDNGGGRSNAVTFNGKYSNHGSLAMPFASYMPYQENTIYVHAAGNTVFMDSALKLGAGKVSNVVLSTNGGGYNS